MIRLVLKVKTLEEDLHIISYDLNPQRYKNGDRKEILEYIIL